MAEILDFRGISGAAPSARGADEYQPRKAQLRALLDEERDDFWPEVSSELWIATGRGGARRENGEGRVLGEIALILGVAAILVLFITAFFGAPQ
ncbi:MAG: hypothetical protein JO261_09605 [Alphaproteobacteria bacterium]|nr:hypothetical protein [Alphaproteobacteria bacterium]MBV9693944.1 hypothetical protein [Alphaproteobacteria bacterium]